MNRAEIVAKLTEVGLVAVVRAESAEQAKKISEACIAGGIAGIEITFTVEGAADIIKELAKSVDTSKVLIGAGTVLDAETARLAILNGAKFVVSPCLCKDVCDVCNRYQIPVMPGAMTVKEAKECMEAGADIIKVFPGELFGPKIIKAFNGPLPQARMMPTGGVSVDNVGEWIKAGAVAVGAGGSLTAGAKTGDYESITRIAKEFIANIKIARNAK